MIIQSYDSVNQQQIQAVAMIEALVQPVDAWSAATLTELLAQDSYHLLLATTTSGVIIGYCLYQTLFEQAEILRIGTRPDFQRQGVANQLFARLHKELQACRVEQLMLEVRADNRAAIRLYESQGFNTIHCRKGYYQQPNLPSVDALILQLEYQ